MSFFISFMNKPKPAYRSARLIVYFVFIDSLLLTATVAEATRYCFCFFFCRERIWVEEVGFWFRKINASPWITSGKLLEFRYHQSVSTTILVVCTFYERMCLLQLIIFQILIAIKRLWLYGLPFSLNFRKFRLENKCNTSFWFFPMKNIRNKQGRLWKGCPVFSI